MNKIYILFVLAVTLFSCKRDPQNVQPVWDGTNAMEGEWEMKRYNGEAVVLPMEGMLSMVATSDTGGTANFDFTLDGISNNVEQAYYDLKGSTAMVYFSRIEGGNSGILVNGESWKVDRLILHDDNRLDTLEMHTDITGKHMLLSKP